MIQTQTVPVCNETLPEAFDGFRIVQIADLHGRRFGPEQTRLIDAVRSLYPDVIAIGGDLADENTDLSTLIPLLDALTEIAPCFYVTGNHEWVLEKQTRQDLFAMLQEHGIHRLENTFYRLQRENEAIILAGVDDPNGPAEQKSPQELVAQIRQTYGDDVYILMLAHRNDQIDLWSDLSVQTVLCAHAHGGIVRIPGLGPVFGTHAELFPAYADGTYRNQDTTMFVSRGLGQSRRLPVRVFNRPQLPCIVLEREENVE